MHTILLEWKSNEFRKNMGWYKGIFICGFFSDSADFNHGPEDEIHTSVGSLDAFLVKYFHNGDW